jgi:uncharacterized sulfatase
LVCLSLFSQEKRPNIIFCFADDWGYYASCFADPDKPSVNDCVITPTIDQLAKEGVNFNRAYMGVPSCTPSRAEVATGCHFWRTGRTAILNNGSWEGVEDPGKKLPGFGMLLQENGYHTGRTYKTVNGYWFPGKIYHDNGKKFCEYSQTVEAAESIEKGHEQLKQEVLANFHDFMNDRKEGQPFCYVWGPHNPHRPWNRGSGKNIWGINPDDLKGKMPPHLPDVHEVREDFADYLGEVQAFDRGVKYLVDELKKIGEYENTFIVLSGDNGIPGFTRGKTNLYDFGVRAPLIVRWRDIQYYNRKVDDFVSLIDLAPTFLDAAGITAPETMDGKSLMPQLMAKKGGQIEKDRNYVIVGRERHAHDARDGNLPYPMRAIHTKDFIYIRNFKPDRLPMGDGYALNDDDPVADWKDLETYQYVTKFAFQDFDPGPTKAFIVTKRNNPKYSKYFDIGFARRPAEELYDLRKDPNQMNSVADDTKYAKIKAKLSAQLMEVLENTNDPRLKDEFDFLPYVEKEKSNILPKLN